MGGYLFFKCLTILNSYSHCVRVFLNEGSNRQHEPQEHYLAIVAHKKDAQTIKPTPETWQVLKKDDEPFEFFLRCIHIN